MDEPQVDPADVPLSEVDRAVIELLGAAESERTARLAALAAADGELSGRVVRRLRALGEYGLLEPVQEQKLAPLPETMGGYRIVRQLGSGGMGVVYLAEQPSLRRVVALKVLHGWRLHSERARERFRREAMAAARLDHPSLCPVLDVGDADGVPFLAMRYVPGKTLGRLIEEARAARHSCVRIDSSDGEAAHPGSGERRHSVLAAVALLERVARAIDVAHRAGLVHRDLKPDNILVEPDGTPVVLDFGLARDASEESLTVSGDHVGTPAYMAPEQVGAPGLGVDARTDVYALGAMLYECLTLELPCPASDRESLYRATLRGSAAEAALGRDGLDRDLRLILAKGMDPDPDRRYATALLFAEDLRRFAAREPILAQPASVWLRARRWTQRNPVIAASLAILAAGLAVATWLSYDRGLALRHARSVDLTHRSREVQSSNGFRAHLLALEAVATERNLETISQLHTTTSEVRQCAEFEHDKQVNSATLSPDGRRVVAGGDDDVALLHSVDGELIERIHLGNDVHFTGMAADGSIVIAGMGGMAKLYDADGRNPRPLLEDREQRGVRAGVLHQTGQLLLVGGRGLAYWWRDVHRSDERVEIRPGTSENLGTCAVSPDGQRFGFAVSLHPSFDASVEYLAFVWTPGQQPVTLRGHTSSIGGMVFRGNDVLTISHDGTLRCWSAEGTQLWQKQHDSRAVAIALSPDGQTIATLDGAGDLWLWSPDGLSRTRAYRHRGLMQRLQYSPDGRLLLLGGFNGSVLILDAEGNEVAQLAGHNEQVSTVAWSQDQSMVLTAGVDRVVRLWHAETVLPRFLGHRDGVRCLAASPDGARLLSGSFDGTARIWSVGQGTPSTELLVIDSQEPSVNGAISSVAWHPTDPQQILLGTWGQVALRIDLRSRTQPQPLPLNRRRAFRSFRAEYSPDGKQVLFGGRFAGGTVILGEAEGLDREPTEGREIPITQTAEITNLAWAPDGRRFAIGTMEGPAYVVELDGTHVRLEAHRDRVRGIGFSPQDGRLLLTGSYDRTLCLWDVASDPPAKLAVLYGHEEGVTAVAWAPDGSRFASASMDGTVRVWSRQGEPLAVLRGHRRAVWDVVFAVDGRRLYSAGDDRTIRTWFVTEEDLLEAAHRLAFRSYTPLERQLYVGFLR